VYAKAVVAPNNITCNNVVVIDVAGTTDTDTVGVVADSIG